jgi:hypothetical protein
MQTPNAARVQRHYKRRQLGLAVFRIELDEGRLVEEMIVSGFLRPGDVDDRAAVAKALQQAVTAMIERGNR